MVEIQVDKMTCDGCAARVTRVVQAIDDSAEAKVNLPKKTVLIESDIDADSLVHAITAAGYPAAVRR